MQVNTLLLVFGDLNLLATTLFDLYSIDTSFIDKHKYYFNSMTKTTFLLYYISTSMQHTCYCYRHTFGGRRIN